MFDLEKMRKVRVLAPKDDVERVIAALYEYGDVEVRPCNVSELDGPLPSFQPVSEMLIKLRAIEHQFSVSGAPVSVPQYTLEEARKQFDALNLAHADELSKTMADLTASRERLNARRTELTPFRKLKMHPEELESASLKFMYFALKPGMEAKLAESLSKVPHQLAYIVDGPKKYALLAVDARQEEAVMLSVLKYASLVLAFPQSDKSFDKAYASTEAELAVVERELEGAKKKFEAFRVKTGPQLEKVKAGLKLLAQKAELPFRFGKTAHFSVVDGWIQERYVSEFEDRMHKLQHALVEYPRASDASPSKLKNAKLVRPFEFLVEFFSLPRSTGLDPTVFVALSFPLFFGMILGDVGYGTMAFLLALYLKLKSKSGSIMNRLAGMLALCAFSTIIFGFVFGEVFGLEHFGPLELHPLLPRLEEAGEIINLSIAIGVVHVALGFILGIVTQAKERHYKHAVAKLSWLLIELGIVALVVQSADISLLEMLKPVGGWIPSPISGLFLVGGILGVAKLEAPTNLVELPGMVGNILSYLRIAALGIAAAVLALIINQQVQVDVGGLWAMVTMQKPFNLMAVLGTLAFALLWIVGNLAALVLGLIESSIQTLRLHYVEFFSKFYEGGGVAFKPLRPRVE